MQIQLIKNLKKKQIGLIRRSVFSILPNTFEGNHERNSVPNFLRQFNLGAQTVNIKITNVTTLAVLDPLLNT